MNDQNILLRLATAEQTAQWARECAALACWCAGLSGSMYERLADPSCTGVELRAAAHHAVASTFADAAAYTNAATAYAATDAVVAALANAFYLFYLTAAAASFDVALAAAFAVARAASADVAAYSDADRVRAEAARAVVREHVKSRLAALTGPSNWSRGACDEETS